MNGPPQQKITFAHEKKNYTPYNNETINRVRRIKLVDA